MSAIDEIRKGLKKHETGYIALIITSAETYIILYFKILKLLLNELKYSGIVVSINKPGPILLDQMKEKGIDPKELSIIDCISEITGVEKKKDGIVYVSSPSNLTELSIEIKKVLDRAKKKRSFVMIDSLASLLIHNSSGSVLRFLNFLTTRMKSMKVGGVFIVVEEEFDKRFINQIIEFCDQVIRV